MAKEKKNKKEHKKSNKKAEKHSKKDKKSKKKQDKNDDNSNDIITEDDYFLKNEEFRVWCKLIYQKPFEDLSSTEARDLFNQQFVKAYNKRRLPEMFYKGL
jgi:hypothetical protein